MRELLLRLVVMPAPSPSPSGASYFVVDPATYWFQLVGAVVAAIITVAGVVYVSVRAGSSLARTIKADREAQILERRLPLYADILVFVAKRRQHREVISAMITMDGFVSLDPFEETEIFDILGRAHALADSAVLEAFDVADEAHQMVQRSRNFMAYVRENPSGGNELYTRTQQMFVEKERANAADAALEAAVRKSLHRDEAEPLERPVIDEDSPQFKKAEEPATPAEGEPHSS